MTCVEVPGADAVGIIFDLQTSTEASCDFVRIYLDQEKKSIVGSAYSGGISNFPSPNGLSPLIVRSNKFWVNFTSDGTNVDWGWKLIAYPVEDELAKLMKRNDVVICESSHPYDNSMDQMYPINVPGAEAVKVYFDPSTKTEANYDYLQFFTDDTCSSQIGAEKYTGSSNYPGIDQPPLVIPRNKFVARFRSDDSNNEWGFKFIVVPTANPFTTILEENPNSQVVESEHPYVKAGQVSGQSEWYIDLAAGKMSELHFDPASNLSVANAKVFFFDASQVESERKSESDTLQAIGPEGGFSSQSGTLPGTYGADPLNLFAKRVLVQLKWDWETDPAPEISESQIAEAWGFRFILIAKPHPVLQFAPDPALYTVVESPHPYPNSFDHTYRVHVPDAENLLIMFDERTRTEDGCDCLCFYSDEKLSNTVSQSISGRDNTADKWPGVRSTPPLVIQGDTTYARFTTDGSVNDWGFLMFAFGVRSSELEQVKSLIEEARKSSSKSVENEQNSSLSGFDFEAYSRAYQNKAKNEKQLCEKQEFFVHCLASLTMNPAETSMTREEENPRNSSNMYDNNMDYWRTIVFPGATKLHVTFDHKVCHTEETYDWIGFYREQQPNDSFLLSITTKDGVSRQAKFFGEPSPQRWPSFVVEGSKLIYRFVSDSSNTFWGFRFSVCPEFCDLGIDVAGLRSIVATKLVESKEMFNVLCSMATDGSRLLGASAEGKIDGGMLLTNMLYDSATRERLFAAYGSEWVLNLFKKGDPTTQERIVRAMMSTIYGKNTNFFIIYFTSFTSPFPFSRISCCFFVTISKS